MAERLCRQALLTGCSTAIVLLSCWMSAQAHETWMLPLATPGTGPIVELALTSGMSFPTSDSPIKPARVTKAIWRQRQAHGALEPGGTTAGYLVLEARLPHGGATTFALVLPPHPITLDAAHVNDYLAELDATPKMRERWRRLGKWREQYRKSVKAIVQVAGAGESDDVTQPIGLPLELVPLKDPQTLKTGDMLRIRVLEEGHPLPSLQLHLQAQGTPLQHARSNADGVVSFLLGRGRSFLVNAVHLRAVDAADRDWDSDFTALTFTVPTVPSTTE